MVRSEKEEKNSLLPDLPGVKGLLGDVGGGGGTFAGRRRR